MGEADAEGQPAAERGVDGHGLLGEHDGMAGVGRHDAGAELDVAAPPARAALPSPRRAR
ncbi:hypothetical protein ACFSTC_22530 [Nonomuraea ferruginea]